MDGYSVKEIAEKWKLTERRVQFLCKNSMIKGVKKIGRDWWIPENAIKPMGLWRRNNNWSKRRIFSSKNKCNKSTNGYNYDEIYGK